MNGRDGDDGRLEGETAELDGDIGGTEADAGRDLPALPVRLLWVFFSPGRLMERLAERPAWVAALLVSALVIGLSVGLTPPEIMLEAQRQAALERGMEMPVGDEALRFMRVVLPVASVVSTMVFAFLFAGLYTVVFAFLLGDEGRFTQYLAVVTHAWFIAALFALLITPLRIATGDPRYTLNLASLFFFLPDGYLYNVFRALDLTHIWSTLVMAQGAHAIDERRGFGSAAAIMLTVLVAVALVVARFV
jgi:hypothetical protein